MYLSHNSRKSLLLYPLAAISLCPVIEAFDIGKILKHPNFHYGAGAVVITAVFCTTAYFVGKNHNPEAAKIRARDEQNKRTHLENMKQLELTDKAQESACQAEKVQTHMRLKREEENRIACATLQAVAAGYQGISNSAEVVARKDQSAGNFSELSAYQTILSDLNLLRGAIGQLPEDKIPTATHLLNTLENYLASIPKHSIDAQQKIHQKEVASAQNQQYEAALRAKELEKRSLENEIGELKKQVDQQKLVNAQAKHTTQTAGTRAIERMADNVAMTADKALGRIDQGLRRIEQQNTPNQALAAQVTKMIGDKVDTLSRDLDGRFQQQGNYNRSITNSLTQITKQMAELQKTVNAAPATPHELPEA